MDDRTPMYIYHHPNKSGETNPFAMYPRAAMGRVERIRKYLRESHPHLSRLYSEAAHVFEMPTQTGTDLLAFAWATADEILVASMVPMNQLMRYKLNERCKVWRDLEEECDRSTT